jgi:archaetidylinositol phosphate synthase
VELRLYVLMVMVFSRLRRLIDGKLLKPIALGVAYLGLRPNHITVVGFMLGFAAFYFYATAQLLLALAMIVASGFMDALDGALARTISLETRFGSVLDAVLDRYVEFMVMIGIAVGGCVEWLYVALAVFSSVMVSYTRARAESSGGLRSCAVGLFERQERLITVIIGTLASLFYSQALKIAIIVIVIFSQITVVQRLYYTWKHAK